MATKHDTSLDENSTTSKIALLTTFSVCFHIFLFHHICIRPESLIGQKRLSLVTIPRSHCTILAFLSIQKKHVCLVQALKPHTVLVVMQKKKPLLCNLLARSNMILYVQQTGASVLRFLPLSAICPFSLVGQITGLHCRGCSQSTVAYTGIALELIKKLHILRRCAIEYIA